MPLSLSLKEALAEVAGVSVAAWALSGLVDPVTASAMGGLAKGLVKGVKFAKKDKTPKEQLLQVIQEATESALESVVCEFVPECREAIIQNIFSYENASKYVLAKDQESLLYNTLREIVGRIPGCDPDTFPVEEIANHIVAFTKEGIDANKDLLLLNTSFKMDAIYAMLMVREGAANQQDAPAPQAKWLTLPCSASSPHYVDRPEFHELMAAVSQHRKVLLCGMGGIGKTELMRKACEALKDDYQQAAWVQYTGNLASSLTSQIHVDAFEALPEKEKLEAIRQLLIRAGEGLLLFVDNVSSTVQDDQDIEWLQRLEGTVIVTSRPPRLLSGFVDVPVDILEEEECKKLFYSYAGIQPLADETELEEIISLAGRHTLVLEILARCKKVRSMSVSDLLQKLREKGFDIKIPVATAHSEEVPKMLREQLEKLYEISDIQDNPLYVHILKNFSILPCLPLSAKDTIAFLELDETQENALYDLRDLGWLEQSDAGFAMHPVIRQVMRKEKVALDDCRGFIDKLLDAADDFFSEVKYMPYITQIAEYFYNVDKLVDRLYNKLSTIHWATGKLLEALAWQMKDIEIAEVLYPDGRHPNLATSYNDLSIIYYAIGNLPEAMKWQMKANEIFEAWYPDKHPSLAICYNNLSMIHQDMGNLPEALKWQMKAKEIMETLFPEGKHPNLATSYNNLSMIHQDMGNLPEALTWQIRAVEIREALFPEGKHPNLASSYNNLSAIHRAMRNLPEALAWQIRANEIWEALFPDGKHPNLASSYNNLSTIHEAMGNLPKALVWQKRAIEIMKALFPDGTHPSLAIFYGNLSSIYEAMGEPEEAARWQKEADRIEEEIRIRGAQ